MTFSKTIVATSVIAALGLAVSTSASAGVFASFTSSPSSNTLKFTNYDNQRHTSFVSANITLPNTVYFQNRPQPISVASATEGKFSFSNTSSLLDTAFNNIDAELIFYGVQTTQTGTRTNFGLYSYFNQPITAGTFEIVSLAPVNIGNTYINSGQILLSGRLDNNTNLIFSTSSSQGAINSSAFGFYSNVASFFGANSETSTFNLSGFRTIQPILGNNGKPLNPVYSITQPLTSAVFSADSITSNYEPIPTPNPTSGAPEPASWALMMIGVGGMGAALRTRRRKVSV